MIVDRSVQLARRISWEAGDVVFIEHFRLHARDRSRNLWIIYKSVLSVSLSCSNHRTIQFRTGGTSECHGALVGFSSTKFMRITCCLHFLPGTTIDQMAFAFLFLQ